MPEQPVWEDCVWQEPVECLWAELIRVEQALGPCPNWSRERRMGGIVGPVEGWPSLVRVPEEASGPRVARAEPGRVRPGELEKQPGPRVT